MTEKTYMFIMEDLNDYENIIIEKINYLIYYIKFNDILIGTILCETGNDIIHIFQKKKKNVKNLLSIKYNIINNILFSCYNN